LRSVRAVVAHRRFPRLFSAIVQIFLDTILNDMLEVRRYPVWIATHRGDEPLWKANAATTASSGPLSGDRLAERLYVLQKLRC
jgi:hypothetical protein